MSTNEDFISIIRQRLTLQYRPCGVQWAVFNSKGGGGEREKDKEENLEWQTVMN